MLRYLAEQRGVSVGTDITIFHPWERPVETFGPLMVDGFGRSRRSSASPTAACSRGMNAILDEFDENFSALTRPDVMAMVANLMMLLGLLGQLPYEGGFKLAMGAPPAIDRPIPGSASARSRCVCGRR